MNMSMDNAVLARSHNARIVPEEGMGCTILYHTERRPGTITFVGVLGIEIMIGIKKDIVSIADDDAVQGSTPTFTYSPAVGDEVETHYYRFHNNAWEPITKVGRNRWKAGGEGLRLVIGQRDFYTFSRTTLDALPHKAVDTPKPSAKKKGAVAHRAKLGSGDQVSAA